MTSEVSTRAFVTGDLIAAGKLAIGDGYRAKNSELSRDGIPFARVGNIDGGFKFDGADHFPLDDLFKVGDKISRCGDVVFTSKGTVGRLAYVRPSTPRFVYAPQLCFWRSLDRDVIDDRWLYYWMSAGEFRTQMLGVKGQTDMADYVSLSDQRRMDITLPHIETQRAIAAVLGSLDDKIEQNRRTGRKLEELARAVFKAWFVDFEPVRAKAAGATAFPGMPPETFAALPKTFQDSPLDSVPKGWMVRRLEDVSTLHYGKALNKTVRQPGAVPVYGSGGVNGTHNEALVTGPGIIVGRKGSVGTLYWEHQDFFPIDTTFYVEPAAELGLHYLFELLQTLGLETMNTDAAVPGLNRENAYRLEVVKPSTEVTNCFEKYAKLLRDSVSHAIAESAKLAALRDYLLPRLLSGKVRVGNLQPTAVIESTATSLPVAAAKPPRKANDEFKEAILISALVRMLATPSYPLGRKRYNKVAYFVHRKAEHDVRQRYLKKAAGPYSPWAKYQGPERIAVLNRYVKRAKVGAYAGLLPDDKIGLIDTYLPRYDFALTLDWAVKQFRYCKNDELELFATVDFAAIDLRERGQPVDARHIHDLISSEPEWAPKLERATFSDFNVARALRELQTLLPADYNG